MKYYEDEFGSKCLILAEKSRAAVRFGAILVKSGRVLGRGWNRRSTGKERADPNIPHVDYCIHAEQAAVSDALTRHKNIQGSTIYVLGRNVKGALAINKGNVFICNKCPKVLKRYQLTVHVPTPNGWFELDMNEAEQTGKLYQNQGYWKAFAKER